MAIKLIKIVAARKRVGRGISAGQGKTAGRGTKGQLSRTGATTPRPKHLLKLPKLRGFKRRGYRSRAIAYAKLTGYLKTNDRVTPGLLVKLGLLPKRTAAKIIGPKTDSKKLRFIGVKVTKSLHG